MVNCLLAVTNTATATGSDKSSKKATMTDSDKKWQQIPAQ